MISTHNGVWISPEIFDTDLKPPGWPDDPDLRRAVDWLLTFLTPEDWRRRRFDALQKFLNAATGTSPDSPGNGRFFDDRDQFGWYLFLAQAFLDHPTIYDHMYGSRVIPVLTAIGRNLKLLRQVNGIESRVRRMVSQEKSQPNACLFELLVAAAYRREGAKVAFLEERPGVAKTHDMDVSLRETDWAVECNRMEGGDSAERERLRARDLWLPAAAATEARAASALCTADFLVELDAVPDDYFVEKVRQWLASSATLPLKWQDAFSIGTLEPLNLGPLQKMLATDDVALSSSRMHELLTGKYKRNAHIISSLRIKLAENPLYVDTCDAGSVFDWESSSDTAINGKARDVLKRLADGCSQLPSGRLGIVHIGFEAVDGNVVEANRYKKVIDSIARFDPNGKALEYVYVSWFAPESPPNTSMAFDETCHWQAVAPTRSRPLDHGFLVLPPDLAPRSGVHWSSPS